MQNFDAKRKKGKKLFGFVTLPTCLFSDVTYVAGGAGVEYVLPPGFDGTVHVVDCSSGKHDYINCKNRFISRRLFSC